MRYRVEIDELVLHGLGHVDRRRVASGLREELGRLVVREGLSVRARERGRVSGGHFVVERGDDRGTGRGIARAVFGELRR